jgi:hypothetical protein
MVFKAVEIATFPRHENKKGPGKNTEKQSCLLGEQRIISLKIQRRNIHPVSLGENLEDIIYRKAGGTFLKACNCPCFWGV